jgi:CRISPR-associated protein Cas2
MMVLISYDVSTITKDGKKRLRNVAKTCQNYGQRVQNSIFECDIDPAQWVLLKKELKRLISEENDSLRFYFLGSNWHHRVEHIGSKPVLDLKNDPLMI